MPEPVAYFEHDADMGIVGRGTRIEEAFENAAAAVFAMMTDLRHVVPREKVEIEFEEADAELALVTWLNLLLGQARSRALIFGRFHLRRDGTSPKRASSGARWRGTAEGEPWRPELERGVEVKGATLTGLAVSERDGIWEARCVVDV
jgi:protein archease